MIRLAGPFAVLVLLTACDAAEPPQPRDTARAPVVQGGPSSASCLDEIGPEAAQALADRCRQVSPATRPPCNVANPCAMIQAEVDRACALWDEQEERPAECGA